MKVLRAESGTWEPFGTDRPDYALPSRSMSVPSVSVQSAPVEGWVTLEPARSTIRTMSMSSQEMRGPAAFPASGTSP